MNSHCVWRHRFVRIVFALWPMLPTLAEAQTAAPITSYELQAYRAADPVTGIPFRVQAIALSQTVCNLTTPPPPTGTVINPIVVGIDDPANLGRQCTINLGTFFSGLPVASGYKATITALYVGGVTARSLPSNPFDVALVPPAAPTGLVVR